MINISQITSSDLFVRLCKALFSSEYIDFQAVDDSGGDSGNDGYSHRERMLFQIYCPEKPERIKAQSYKTKIKRDLSKAKELVESGRYDIKTWVFVTPGDLREPVLKYLREEAEKQEMEGISWSSYKLTSLLSKHPAIEKQFPELSIPDISRQISELQHEFFVYHDHLDDLDEVKRNYKSELERGYARRIDHAKIKIDQYKYDSAKYEYELILSDLADEHISIHHHIYFRAHYNLGVCQLNLGNQSSAVDHFERAYEFEPKEHKAQCMLALSKVINGVPTEGLQIIESALRQNPNDSQAINTKAHILYAMKMTNELRDFLKKSNKPEFTHWFEGLTRISEGDREAALSSLELAVKFAPKDYRRYMLLAGNIMEMIQPSLRCNPLPPYKLQPDLLAKLERATACLEEAIRLLTDTEIRSDLELAYTNLSACYGNLGRHQQAIEVAGRALAINSTSVNAHMNIGLAYFEQHQYKEARKNFQLCLEVGGSEEVKTLSAFCSMQLGDLDDVELYISKELSYNGPLNLKVAELAVDLYSRQMNRDSLNIILSRLESEYPTDSHALRVRASYFMRLKQDDALALLQKAIDYARCESDRLTAELLLAEYYNSKREYKAASILLRKHSTAGCENPATLQYGYCLINSGQYGDILKWLETLNDESRRNVKVVEIEAWANYHLNNLAVAAPLFKRLYERDPKQVHYIVSFGMCQFRLGYENEAKAAFASVKSQVTEMQDLMTLAAGYQHIGDSKTAVELIYTALQLDPNNPRVHFAYISAMIRYEQSVIDKLDQKYITAFQKSLSQFNDRFPEESGLQRIEINNDDISGILNILDNAVTRTNTLLSMYSDGRLPLGVLPQFLGKSSYDIWKGLIVTPAVGLRMSNGSVEELMLETQALRQAEEVVVDVYPLYLLAGLGQLDILLQMFSRIYIHQSVMDELLMIIDECYLSVNRGQNLIGVADGHYQVNEIPPEPFQLRLEELKQIRDFINGNDNVVVCGFSSVKNYDDQRVLSALADSTRDSLLLAEELRVPLYCDDIVLRLIALQEFKVKAFSSQSLFILAASQGIIDYKSKLRLRRGLIEFNYHYIGINATMIIQELISNNFNLEESNPVIAQLILKQTTTKSLANVLLKLYAFLIRYRPLSRIASAGIIRKVIKQASLNHEMNVIQSEMLESVSIRVPPEEQNKMEWYLQYLFSEFPE